MPSTFNTFESRTLPRKFSGEDDTTLRQSGVPRVAGEVCSLEDFVNSLKRQPVLLKKEADLPIILGVEVKMFTDHCTLRKRLHPTSELTKCRLNLDNFFLHYHQEMFLRVLGFITSKFLWALTETDPYKKPAVKDIDEIELFQNLVEVNKIQTLQQVDFGVELSLSLSNLQLVLKERPYVHDREFVADIRSATLQVQEESLYGMLDSSP